MTATVTAEITPASWLKQIGTPWRRSLRITGLLVVADVVPAIGFAAGLALTLASLQGGDAFGSTFWLGLALSGFSLIVRGLLGQRATRMGALAAMAIKGNVRRSLARQLFGARVSEERLTTAVAEGVGALDGYYARFDPTRFAAAATPLIVIAVCALASPVSAAILILTLIPFVIGMVLAGTAAGAESRRQFESLERLSGLFLDRVRALPVLLAFQAEGRTVNDIARGSDDLARRTGRVLKVAFLSSAVLEFFSALSVALVAVYCGFNLLRLLPFPVPETLDLARAIFILALAPEVYAPMRRLAAAYHDRQAAEAAAFSLMTSETVVPSVAASPRIWLKPPAICFQNVAIAYETSSPVIAGFDLDVSAGSMVAIVGPSGSGKTSLLRLLLGLAPLSEGDVEIGDLRLSQIGSLSGAVGWAGQHPMVIPGSLGDNLALVARAASGHQLLEAAGRAGLHGDLDRSLDERGGGLSGGERRRLGLARALLSPSRILVLDEPTANLDAASEADLIPVLREAARGRTTLIATHSAAVWNIADHVVRL
ncbi:MAG TPA: thiol reductant ABC exporter subunit CydD [Brevundimonas sp.]|jgi:ATP-binding cassette subfamily C protein CydD